MKKKILLLMILSTSLFSLFAQETTETIKKSADKKFYLGVSFGLASPVGDFASKSTDTNAKAGFAKTGFNTNLHFGYLASKHFGFASNFSYSTHQIKSEAFYAAIQDIDPSFRLSADHWQYFTLLVGPMATVSASDKAFFDFKLLGGISNINFPTVRGTSGSVNASSKEKWETAFAWQIATNFRYNFTPNAFFLVNLDYSHTKPKANITVTNGSTEVVGVEQEVGVINTNVGIGINF
jgi:hypothetical protein